MKPLTSHQGLVMVLNRSNVDTDAIIPKQFLKSIRRTGYGDFIFDEWRYLDHGEPGMDCSKRPLNKDFEFNQARYQGASILLTGVNFGCGSSREHAVWGLSEYGFKIIIAPSFADIFYQNCAKNGVLAVLLEQEQVDKLKQEAEQTPGYTLEVRVQEQTILTPRGEVIHFDIDKGLKERFMKGLDDIALSLTHVEQIKAFEKKHFAQCPWLENRIQGK